MSTVALFVALAGLFVVGFIVGAEVEHRLDRRPPDE